MVRMFYVKASKNKQILSKCKVTKWEMIVLEDMGIPFAPFKILIKYLLVLNRSAV